MVKIFESFQFLLTRVIMKPNAYTMPIAEQSPLVYIILIMMSSIIILWAKRLWIREVQDSGQGYAAKKRHSQSQGRPRCQRMVL